MQVFLIKFVFVFEIHRYLYFIFHIFRVFVLVFKYYSNFLTKVFNCQYVLQHSTYICVYMYTYVHILLQVCTSWHFTELWWEELGLVVQPQCEEHVSYTTCLPTTSRCAYVYEYWSLSDASVYNMTSWALKCIHMCTC